MAVGRYPGVVATSGPSIPIPQLRITAVLVFSLAILIIFPVKGEESTATIDEDENYLRGLFPPTFNLATEAIITANATCGQEGPETFCKLVEHVSREPQCGVCDSRSVDGAKRHPITNAIDGSNNWWQSPSLQNGRQYEWITITLDLRQVYQVAYLIVKAANSPRPGNWVLERSLDGIDYKPWQYYVILDVECLDLYGVAPTVGIPRYISDDEVICTSFFSKLNPIENGEIHTSLVNGRPGALGPSDKLQEFTSARYVRLRFQKMRTLNADLMSVSNRNWDLVDKSVTRRLFYSIKDISIGGQCMCFGHARDCPQDTATNRLKCRCVHNTCGDSCEKCCPLYNRNKWRVGTSADAGVCAKCQCFGHADECRYDEGVAARRESLDIKGRYEGGGVCINCREFTAGNNCELCLEGFYRPIGVARHDPRPCRKCLCDGAGATGRCVQDDSGLAQGLTPGDCICRDGFSGLRCEKCAPGHRNYPICDPCPCNFAGTVNSDCDGECICKANVDGLRCDRCKPGFFNLDDANPVGCTKCYCFGITEKCDSAMLGVEVLTPKNGWKVSALNGEKIITPTLEGGLPTVANDDMIGYDTYYWLAPKDLVGNKLNSYGGRLRANISWVTARGDSAGKPTIHPDIVLKGAGLIIAYGDRAYSSTNNVLLDIILAEQNWYHLTSGSSTDQDRTAVRRREFMEVLLAVDVMLLRAKYLTDQLVAKLHTAAMEVGSSTTVSINVMKNIEKCSCPPGYAGLSCEICDYGYRRVNGTVHEGECRKCDCNGHAEECDVFTGQCLLCLHNTTGERCESCKPGFYGIATVGSPDDCRPCACPLEDARNNFSPDCKTNVTIDGAADYVCTRCPAAYEGAKCERCADGFFGDPLVAGNLCRPCNCSGNIDIAASGNCDRTSGKCLKCTGNTQGWNCESCASGFYGQGWRGNCRACDCNMHGSLSPSCDREDGRCECRLRYVGRNCDKCEGNYGNIAAGCERCKCDVVGSASVVCDPVSGLCDCKPGVFGARCDSCIDGYYNFAQEGCTWCGCDDRGSRNKTCDSHTGQCLCWPSVEGRSCNACKIGFWNLTAQIGCEACDCDKVGSSESVCDPSNGVCSCKLGVGGRTCSECLPKHFAFSTTGCKQCAPCDAPGHVCHPHTGDCVCPPYTEGAVCEKCRTNTWGYDPYKGCKPCECSSSGSAGPQCDVTDGQCSCLEGFEGIRCDTCHFGYFDFPKCKKCRCHADGSLPRSCRADGQCECGEDGQCRCRENTSGKKCRRCKPGAFGLSSTNLKGCFECTCFGKSDQCVQAEYSWSELTLLETRQVSAIGGETALNASNGLRVVPGSKGDVALSLKFPLDSPIYWTMPDAFKGDRVLSYNGRLSFSVEVEGGQPYSDSVLKSYPLVQLQGNFRVILVHYVDVASPDGRYEVRLHEDFWKIKNNHESPVTRQMMMVALQNVQQILIRATDSADFYTARLHDVRLDVAVPATPFSPVVAVGVEICQCPHNYVGTSCQDPAVGYYRYRKKDFLNSKDILDLVGISVPCPCNNRSNTCDKETGICRHCRENTSGLFCEICSIGYYGRPNVAPCIPCACPTINQSYSDSCEMDGLGGFVCTNCLQGYAGNFCERCADGFYGDPLTSKTCSRCSCDVRGSAVSTCHPVTGQCVCLPGITGRDCSQCEPRHALTDRGCQSCDDNCTGLLLDDLDDLKSMVASVNLTGLTPAPWDELLELEQAAAKLKERVDAYGADVQMGKQLIVDFETTFNLEGQADLLYLKSVDARRNSAAVLANASDARSRADAFLKETLALQSDIDTIVKGLISHAVGLNNASVNIKAALKEAEKLLMEIRGRNFISMMAKAENELNKAKALLDLVRQLVFDPVMLGDLRKKLESIKDKINDVMQRLTEIRNAIQETKPLNTANKQKLLNLKNVHGELNVTIEQYENSKSEAGDDLNEADEWIKQSSVNLEVLGNLTKNFTDWVVRMDGFVNHMSRINARYEKIYVRPAEEHALRLMREAMSLNAIFNETREVSHIALTALSAYDDVSMAFHDTLAAARNANVVAVEAYEKAHRNNEPYLKNEARRLLNLSKNLSSDAKSVRDKKIPGLRAHLNDVDEAVDFVGRQNDKVAAEIVLLGADMDRYQPADLSSNISESLNKAEEASDMAAKVSAIVRDVQRRLEEELRPKLDNLTPVTDAGLDDVNGAIQKALDKNKELHGRTRDLENKQKNLTEIHNQTQLNLRLLQARIERFKRTAWGIRDVSLGSSNGTCKRSIKVNVEPSVTTSLVLRYAIRKDEVNSSILFLSSPNYNKPGVKMDFMAVEMVNGQIRFAWNAGNDSKAIEHSFKLEPNDELLTNKSRWYQIEIKRTGNIGNLTVRPSDKLSTPDPSPSSGATVLGVSIMDLDNNTRCFIGGYPDKIKVPSVLKSGGRYLGCLKEVVLNEARVGLWNFETNRGCTGCKIGIQDTGDGSKVRFSGNGYAVIDGTRLRHQVTFVSLQFRTFDEDALLVFLPNNQTKDHMLLELRGGHVVFQFGKGGRPAAVLRTNNTYNNGKGVIVMAEYNKSNIGKLSVNIDVEQHMAALELTGNGGLDLKKRDIYMGGVPPAFPRHDWSAMSFMPLAGCMLNVQLERHAIDFLDPNTTKQSYGMEPSCNDPVLSTVAFSGDGYLELPAQPLKKSGTVSFGFSFQTDKPDALLLFSSFSKDFYYSAALKGGQLHVQIGNAILNKSLQTQATYHDGKIHNMLLTRKGREIELFVNDEKVQAVRIQKAVDVNLVPQGQGGLFFGGVSDDVSIDGLAASTVPLSGIVRDPVFNNKVLNFHETVRFERAVIGYGRNRTSTVTNGKRREAPNGTQKCVEVVQYTVESRAVKFGDNAHSFVQLPATRNNFRKEFNLTFGLRTFYPNGLVLFADRSQKKGHYFMIYMTAGNVNVVIQGKKKFQIKSNVTVNDGQWQQVILTKVRRKLELTVRNTIKRSIKVPKQLNISPPIFVGGLQQGYRLPNITNGEPFKGCIRNLALNGKVVDLAGGKVNNVGQCFNDIVAGSYFAGDAYATYAASFEVGAKMDMQLSFRTTKLNGILLSVSEPSNSPALALEIYRGNVTMSVDFGDGQVHRVTSSFDSQFYVCDNKWHVVKAFYSAKELSIKVDKMPIQYNTTGKGIFQTVETTSPLYIGGLPESSTMGVLKSQDNFIGCIRNLVINEKNLDWTDMAQRRNVQLDSCAK